MPPGNRPPEVSDVEWLKFRFSLFKERLEALVDQKLLSQEAKLAKIEVDDKQLSEVVERRWQGTFESREKFLEYLRKLNMSEREFREQVRQELMAREIIRQRIQFDRTISPTELLAYYEEHIDDFCQGEKRRLHLVQIPVKLQSGEDGAQFSANLVKELRGNPGSFAEAARKHSVGPAASEGGDMGWIERDKGLRKDLRDVAFTLEKSKVSDVVSTPHGFFILKVDEIQKGEVQTFEQAQAEIRLRIQNQRYLDDRKKLLDGLRERGYVATFLPNPDFLQ
jgi:parvulin-like peptidyl-prolyl isomerase